MERGEDAVLFEVEDNFQKSKPIETELTYIYSLTDYNWTFGET
jgi:hypothetical protein